MQSGDRAHPRPRLLPPPGRDLQLLCRHAPARARHPNAGLRPRDRLLDRRVRPVRGGVMRHPLVHHASPRSPRRRNRLRPVRPSRQANHDHDTTRRAVNARNQPPQRRIPASRAPSSRRRVVLALTGASPWSEAVRPPSDTAPPDGLPPAGLRYSGSWSAAR